MYSQGFHLKRYRNSTDWKFRESKASRRRRRLRSSTVGWTPCLCRCISKWSNDSSLINRFRSLCHSSPVALSPVCSVSLRDSAEAHFGGHPYTTRRAVNAWIRDGLAKESTAKGPKGTPFKVLTLTRSGAAAAERYRVARELGLPIDAQGRVLYPDAQIEYFDAPRDTTGPPPSGPRPTPGSGFMPTEPPGRVCFAPSATAGIMAPYEIRPSGTRPRSSSSTPPCNPGRSALGSLRRSRNRPSSSPDPALSISRRSGQ